MSKLRKIHLHGQLKEYCGGNSTVELVGDSITILINGLASMFGQGVKEIVKANNWQVFLDNDKQGKGVHESQVNRKLEDTSDVFLYPAVEGAGKVGNIILGIVMIVVGAFMIWGSGGTVGWETVAEGAMLMIAGAMTIYTALNTPSASKNRAVEENPSFIFNGAQNVTEQGGAVPCVYGRFRTGSVVVSAGIDSEQMTVYNSGYSHNPAPKEAFDRYDVVLP